MINNETIEKILKPYVKKEYVQIFGTNSVMSGSLEYILKEDVIKVIHKVLNVVWKDEEEVSNG